MRLTLRTLLAYLDDTLEPAEIKKIGQKVAESDAAQELVARIKQVTRRRRITTPPATGANAFDANMVADYLDNEIASEQISELEKICLESDVHLAEVASCHQILTLVLSEQALVPPTAKERMYALVQGREAIPFRKAAAPGAFTSAPTSADADADSMFLLGLPFYRRGSWLRWALPVAGVLLLAVVAVALWQSIAVVNPPAQIVNANKTNNTEVTPPKDNTEVTPPNIPPAELVRENASGRPNNTVVNPSNNTVVNPPNNTDPPNPNENVAARRAPPNKERGKMGSYYSDSKSPPSILVQRKDDKDTWHRLRPGTEVFSHDELISLPGYASELRLDSGVHLYLRGHVREYSLMTQMNYLQESAVVLHKNKEVDVDVTLKRGRLYLSNHKDKDPAAVRLRFDKEAWDLTLEPGAEVVVDLIFQRSHGESGSPGGDEPVTTLFLLVMEGNAGVAIEGSHYPNLSRTGPAFFQWGNKGVGAQGPNKIEAQDRAPFAKTLPPVKGAEGMEVALRQLSGRLLSDKAPTVALQEVLQTNPSLEHRLAIYCFGALDDIKDLIKILGSTDTIQNDDRDTAIFTLRRWLGRDARNASRLYDAKTESGLLITSGQEYRPQQAEVISLLLDDFSTDAIINPETYDLLAGYLLSEKPAIAELAHWHLARLSLTKALPDLQRFDATAPRTVRVRLADAVKKLVESKLPREAGAKGPPNGKPSKDVKKDSK